MFRKTRPRNRTGHGQATCRSASRRLSHSAMRFQPFAPPISPSINLARRCGTTRWAVRRFENGRCDGRTALVHIANRRPRSSGATTGRRRTVVAQTRRPSRCRTPSGRTPRAASLSRPQSKRCNCHSHQGLSCVLVRWCGDSGPRQTVGAGGATSCSLGSIAPRLLTTSKRPLRAWAIYMCMRAWCWPGTISAGPPGPSLIRA